MRTIRDVVLPLLALAGGCGSSWCTPTPTPPPPADACSNATNTPLTSVEVGVFGTGAFVPYSADGHAAPFTRGLQGSDMIGVRLRITSASPVACLAQKTTLMRSDGSENGSRSESVNTYEQGNTRVTRDLWVVADSTLMVGEDAILQVEAGGQVVRRTVRLVAEDTVPAVVGIAPSVVCTGQDVPGQVGVDRGLPGGTVVVAHPANMGLLLGGHEENALAPGARSAGVTLRADTAGTFTVSLGSLGGSLERDVTATAASPGLHPVSPSSIAVRAPGTARIRLELSCAAATDTVVTSTVNPAGLINVPASITVPAGRRAVEVEVSAAGGATGTSALSFALGSTVQTVNVDLVVDAPAAQTGDVAVEEVLFFDYRRVPDDVDCSGDAASGESFIEVVNRSAGPVAMDGVGIVMMDAFEDVEHVAHQFPAGTVLGSGHRVVVLMGSGGVGSAAHPWCQALQRESADGRVVLGVGIGSVSADEIRVVRGGAVLSAVQSTLGYFGGARSAVALGAFAPVDHGSAATDAVDRAFTPGTASDAPEVVR